MAILLQTIVGGTSSPIKERDGGPYSRTALIDPDVLYKPQGNIPAVYQDSSLFTPDVLNLHERMQQLTGLFLNSSELQKVAGEHQVVGIGLLERALNEIPGSPVSLDVLPFDHTKLPGPLVNFFLERASSLVPYLKINMEFNDNPRWLPSNSGLLLRDSHTGERMKPVFYQQASLPEGLGRLDSEGWRGGPSPLFGILQVNPAPEYRISPSAVSFVDRYVTAALKDPHTLG